MNNDLISREALKETFERLGYTYRVTSIIDNAPTVEDLISAKDFKKRINNMEYVYIQDCAADVLDAIDCEVTYFKEK